MSPRLLEAANQARQYLLGPTEEECRADLELLQESPDAHLSNAITDGFLELILTSAEVELVLRHLRRCVYCRVFIVECLELSAAEDTHPAYQWVRESTEWAHMADAGKRATAAARTSLQAAGVRPVYKQEGILVEELPDGTTRPYAG